MSLNRRIPEASALRAFFQEQWEILQSLLDARQAARHRKQLEQDTLIDAVEFIVESTDARVRLVGDYKKRLRGSARELLDHIESLVDGLPPAVALTSESFVRDPWVNALFRNPVSMHQLFSCTREVQAFFDNPKHRQYEEVFALLFANRTEKRFLGSQMRGYMLISGVVQTAVSFAGHSLALLRPNEAQARSTVKEMLFEAVIQFLWQRMTQLKYEEDRSGKPGVQSAWANPDFYLERLLEQMRLPQSLVRLQDDQIRINSMGIKLPPDQSASARQISLQELGIGDRPARVVALVRYPRAEHQRFPDNESFHFI